MTKQQKVIITITFLHDLILKEEKAYVTYCGQRNPGCSYGFEFLKWVLGVNLRGHLSGLRYELLIERGRSCSNIYN
jgi:hypothetical protein